MDAAVTADEAVNPLNDSSQGPGIPTSSLWRGGLGGEEEGWGKVAGSMLREVLSLLRRRTLILLGCKGTGQEQESMGVLGECCLRKQDSNWHSFPWPHTDLLPLAPQGGGSKCSPLQGDLCKTLKVKPFPRAQVGAGKFAGWIQASPGRCDSVNVLRSWTRPWLILTLYTQKPSQESKVSLFPASQGKVNAGLPLRAGV